MNKQTPLTIDALPAYREAFEQGSHVEIPEDSELRGRILRGKTADDFMNLGLPGRELTFIMGPDGLAQLPGQPLSVALGRIGLGEDYVAGRIAQGYSFKLAVFEGGAEAPLATWDNTLDLVAHHHPRMIPDIEANRQALRTTPFAAFADRMLPDSLEAIDLAGPMHPAFMTTERYFDLPEQQRQTNPLHLRRWLLHTERIGVLFNGDGYTQSPDGEQGLREYLAANVPIVDLRNAVIIDLPFDAAAPVIQ